MILAATSTFTAGLRMLWDLCETGWVVERTAGWALALRPVACSLAALVAACQPQTIVVPLPGGPSDRTMILAAEPSRAHVVDLGAQPEPLMLLLPAQTTVAELEAWIYQTPIADLRLSPGVLARDLEAGVPLPSGAQAYRYRALGPGAAGWEDVEPRASALSAFRARIPHCYRLRLENAVLEAQDTGVVATIPLPGGGILLGTTKAELFVVTATGATRLEKLGEPEFYAVGGVALGEGQLLLGAEQGAIATATMEGPRVTIRQVALGAVNPRYMAGGGAAAAPEVFVLARGYDLGPATIGRYFEGRWSALTTLPDGISESIAGGVVWLGPGQAIAGMGNSARLWRYSEGRLADEALGATLEGISALSLIEGFGEVVGTVVGTVYRRQDGAWHALPGFPPGAAITALAPFEDGFWFAQINGHFGYYKPDHGVCLATETAPNSPTVVAPAGECWIVAGHRAIGFGSPQLGRVYVDR